MKKQKIILWDENSQRLMTIETNLRIVMKKMKIDADVQLNSELPLLKRNGVHGKTPSLQVNDGDFWTYQVGEVITQEALQSLFEMLFAHNLLHK